MLKGMFKSEVKGGYWQIIKIIIAIIASVLFIQQLMFIGDWIIEKNHYGREINASDYENLNNGEKVWGKLDSVAASAGFFTDANGVSLSNYVVKSENEKLIIFRTETGSKCDKAIQEVLSGKSDGFYFCGYAKPLTGNVRTSVMMTLVANNTLNKNKIDGGIDDALITSMVDASFFEEYSDSRIIVASFVGAFLMLFIIFLCLKKIVKDIVYTINASRGKIDTYVPADGFNSEDAELTYYSDFDEVQSDFHKEYRERIEEGELEINYDDPEEVEYYQDYETDAIDFNEEEKGYRTIYGEEYTRPKLERDIQTYGGYEYDSMDFAQSPVEKKDIDKF